MRNSSHALRPLAQVLYWMVCAIGCSGSDASQGGGDTTTGGMGGGAVSGMGGGAVSGMGGGAVSGMGGGAVSGAADEGVDADALAGSAGVGNGGRAGGDSGTDAGGGVHAGASGQSASGDAAGGGTASDGAANGGVTNSATGDTPGMLPRATESCPQIKSGKMTFLGQAVTVWAGTPSASAHGPLVIYWHATGGVPQEAVSGLGQAAIDEITAAGGMVAAQAQTNGKGTNTGNNVWFTGDFEVADEIVACAIEQLHIDTRRIYASGFSAGGLQTTWMAYARSGYLAAVVPYSGGLTGLAGFVLTPIRMPQDPSNVPAAMAVHGQAGSDVLVLDFSVQSRAYLDDVKAKGGFGIECDHGGGHMIPANMAASTWQFLKAHPFKTKPSPYAAGLPASFPSYCKIY